jgi:hypothetical protein
MSRELTARAGAAGGADATTTITVGLSAVLCAVPAACRSAEPVVIAQAARALVAVGTGRSDLAAYRATDAAVDAGLGAIADAIETGRLRAHVPVAANTALTVAPLIAALAIEAQPAGATAIDAHLTRSDLAVRAAR